MSVVDKVSVKVARDRNADVFLMPTVEWSLLYTHEELTELARAVQQSELPKHLRGSADKRDAELEWGQAYMMHLTTAILLDIDVEAALARAIQRIYERSQAKRERQDATR